jgi:hypothetical protein
MEVSHLCALLSRQQAQDLAHFDGHRGLRV